MINIRNTYTYLCLIFCLFAASASAQVEVYASLDKNPVMADESFNLTVVANGNVNSNAFDSSVLLKNFTVGRTSVSSQTKMVNFNTTKSTTWTTVLIPKSTGRFTIPALDVAGSQTQPIEVLVVPVSTANAKQRDLFITTSTDVQQAYLQQQIHYTVKLHLAKELQRGSLSSPTLENADIRQIGEDKEYSDIINGKRYRIIERSFAIVPQQSGTFVINSPLFEGEVTASNGQSFGFFNRSQAVNRTGPSQTIEVLPIPSDYQEHWLPSEFVQLNEEWQGNEQAYEAGEPITRTITLTALGVIEEQLPTIDSQYPSSVKTYPDQAETATIEKDNTLIAQHKQSIAIIPTQAGSLVIPEVTVPWFNTITKRTEYAVLPAKTLIIQPASQLGQAAPLTRTERTEPLPTAQPVIQQVGVASVWQWLALAFLCLWLATLALWFWLGRKPHPAPATSQVRRSGSEQALWKTLSAAFKANDAKASHDALCAWLGHYTQQPNTPLANSLRIIGDDELSVLVEQFLASRYAKKAVVTDNRQLYNKLHTLRKTRHTQGQNDDRLPALYPSS